MHARLVRVCVCGEVRKFCFGRCPVPMLNSRRAEGYIARVQDFQRLPLDLMVADTVGHYKDLAARMRMPVVVSSCVKDNVVNARCSGFVLGIQHIAEIDVTRKIFRRE